MGARVLVAAVVAAILGAAGAAPAQALEARGSTTEAYVVDAKPREGVRLTRNNATVLSGRTDRFGSFIFRELEPGAGYRVVGSSGRPSAPFSVLAPDQNPPGSFYDALPKLKRGLNYVKMRDGVELAMTVRLPPGKTMADGPFPTVIEYSGYQVAAPHPAVLGAITDDPLAPASSTLVGGLLSPIVGFATVSVQMRGSGCSGGAFDLFSWPTTYDGYDAIETVARQPWAKGGKVGMVGISFSGISQLFTAGTRPPHLAAVAPLSVTDDLYSGTGDPGGIFNQGFAKSWIQERMEDAEPAPEGGQPYAQVLTRRGDSHCRDNQKLRLQTQDALQLVRDKPFRTPSLFEHRSPAAWLDRIDVPTFLAGQYQDEQTGGHFTEMLGILADHPRTWITLQNGPHVDSVSPSILTRWFEFNALYVGDEVPELPKVVVNGLGRIYTLLLANAPGAPVQQSRFAGTTDVAAARATFERDPRVRLLMDNGAGPQGKGSIGATWELAASSWPPREAVTRRLWLGRGGTLGDQRQALQSTASYVADPNARPAQTLDFDPIEDSDAAWAAQPPYDWTPLARGKGLGFTTAPLAQDVVVAGPSSLDLQLQASAPDTDLQVGITEVRPDGQETYVQSGFLRASHRKLAADSTETDARPTHLAQDAAPLAAGRWNAVRVPIFGVTHAFRAGSRIRVTVSAVGGDRPVWDFDTVDKGTTRVTAALGGVRASSLALPVLPDATAQGTPLPAPTALRGEPSRRFRPASNGG